MFSLLVFLAFNVLTFCSAEDYCNVPSCKGKPNTMCLYASDIPSSECTGLTSNSFTNTEINEILNIHNTYRQKVASGKELRGSPGPQPAAKEMPNVTWDQELSTIAQRWANQCIYKHDECRDTPEHKVGQNIGYEASTDPSKLNITHIIKKWYDEVENFDKNTVSKYRQHSGTGHYTQMIWAKSIRIGCGKVEFQKKDKTELFIVCNYEPAGNIEGEDIYEVKN